MVKFNIKNVNKLVVEENDCYTYTRLTHKNMKSYRYNLAAVFIITIEGSDRTKKCVKNTYKIFKNSCPIIVVENKGFRKCNKPELPKQIARYDLMHANKHIMSYAKKTYPNRNIMIVEDDCIWVNSIKYDIYDIFRFLKDNRDVDHYFIGAIQSNKTKEIAKNFDWVHSVDSEKLARKLSEHRDPKRGKLKIFIQVNIGNEQQKFGVDKLSVSELYSYCKTLDLEVVGLMCIPPINKPSEIFFKEMSELNKKLNFEELSMGMSSDYLNAIQNCATYVRIGSNIFGQRIR